MILTTSLNCFPRRHKREQLLPHRSLNPKTCSTLCYILRQLKILKFIIQCNAMYFSLKRLALVFCFSYFLYFTCGRLSTDLLGKELCQRGKMKIPSITYPWQEASPKLQGGFEKGFMGKEREGRWLNTVSEMMTSKLIILAPNFPFWYLIDISNLSPKQNTWFAPLLPKPALIHLIKSYHWSPNSLGQKHESHFRFFFP